MIVYSTLTSGPSPLGVQVPAVSLLPGCTSFTRLGDPASSGGRVPVDVQGIIPGYQYPMLQPGDDYTTFAGYQNAMLSSVALFSEDAIASGFTYSGQTYPLDQIDQIKWHIVLDLTSSLTFPILVTTLSGTSVVSMDQATAVACAGAALATGFSIDQAAASLIQAITTATTAAQLDAINIGG